MLPAGLSFNAVSPKALAASEHARTPRSYWDWKPIIEANETGFWPYTSATNLLYGLREALTMLLREEGLSTAFARHQRHAAATRAAVEAWGLEVLALDPRELSAVLTGVVLPDGYDADEVRGVILESFDMSLGAGLGKLKGRIFRIGHLGDFNDLMLAGTLCGVEMGLRIAGVPISPGVPAALELLEREAAVAGVTALEDIRVLELTQVMAGPFCGQVLADMGADVIKVEPPGGDSTRRSLGFRMSGDDTAAFLAVNRNKRSLTLDLKVDAHREAFHRLARDADVVLENNRPGVAARLGVDYETLAQINPRLVYASISGFGQTGPYAQRPGYDLIAQGLAGVMSVTGEPDGNPVKCGIPIGDLSAGLFCAVAILSALHARERTGRGQYVDTSLFEGALALSIWETAELWATGRVPGKLGSAHRLTAPYQALRTGDGYITVGGNNQKLFERLCAAVGPHRSGRRPALRHQRRAHGQRRASWSPSSSRRSPRAAPTSGWRRWSRAASRAARSTTTPRSSTTRTRRRARWRSRSSTRSRGRSARSASP